MNQKAIIVFVVIAAVIIIGTAAYVLSSQSHTSGMNATPMDSSMNMPASDVAAEGTSTMAQATTSKTTAAEDDFTITGSNFSFAPKQITVNKGDTVKITFVNSNGFHDFHIDEFNVASNKLKSGQQQVLTFVADKSGSFQYYCSVGQHRAMGMWGTLTVK